LAYRIGNQTARSAPDPLTPYRFALEHGFEAFEFFSDRKDGRGFDFASLGPEARENVRREGRARDMRFTVHAPVQAEPFSEEGARSLHEAVDFAGAVGAALVVLHAMPETDLDAFLEALQPPVRHADGVGVRLAVENTPGAAPGHFNALFARLQERGQTPARVGMCFDMGHANVSAETRNDYLGYFDALEGHVPIIHVHAHENHGDGDTHLTLGTGPAGADARGVRGLVERLGARGFDGALILEQWPEPPKLLCEARDLLRSQMP
jgi:sugar phosphate isomerase/epimerase